LHTLNKTAAATITLATADVSAERSPPNREEEEEEEAMESVAWV
jgi:hypothetical protein